MKRYKRKLFKKKNKAKTEFYEWPSRGYLLFSKDGKNYKIIADITEEAKDMEPSVLCVAPVIYKNYQGDGYYMFAMRDKGYFPMDVVLQTRWQFNLFSGGGEGETLAMIKNEMQIARRITYTNGMLETPLEEIYSRDNFISRYH